MDGWIRCPRPVVVRPNGAGQRRRLGKLLYCHFRFSIKLYKGRENDDGDWPPVVGILGATGSGKSRLSIDIATRFSSEVVNSDKMQVYNGLDITTNKMPMVERQGVPHHLLGEFDHTIAGEITPMDFRLLATERIESIRSRGRVPIIAGGSNSFVHALLSENHVPDINPFAMENTGSICGMKYRSCRLLWIHVGWSVLKRYIDKRVDDMVEMGMVEELATHFDRNRAVNKVYKGLEKAIGVEEMDGFFLQFPPLNPNRSESNRSRVGEKSRYEEAIQDIKRNSRILARRQVEKISVLRDVHGWDIRLLDATEAVKRKVEGAGRDEIEKSWEKDVMFPAMEEMENLFYLGDRIQDCSLYLSPCF
ncbi:tRNA dimethylallyltransferase [Zostera marina]|uniref:tRNA dimethylallyltransferase n=1 Tax=Zostera marina TaxID=29655 RepID=A0A0K9NQM2_ZOSMR|nr:tRNA dimethylallyltransferase [Zostera marina]